jgi:hypothetical protein
MYRRREVAKLLISALTRRHCSVSGCGRFVSRESATGTHWIINLESAGAGMEAVLLLGN